MNLGEQEESGADLSASYNFSVAGQKLGVGADYSRKFYTRKIKSPGQPVENTLGEFGEPAWRASTTLGYSPTRSHAFTLRNNIIGPHDTQEPTETATRLESFSTYDIQYAWTHQWDGTLAFGAINVLNNDFPQDPSQRAGDGRRAQALYSADGRILYMKATQVF